VNGAGAAMNGDDAVEAVRAAERTAYHTQWRIWEELALEQLARSRGLARLPLVPGSEVIQLVSCDGVHLGHVRRDGEYWVAVTVRAARPCGRYGSAEAAARGLARACGKDDGPRR
jgi:hypothetical protein